MSLAITGVLYILGLLLITLRRWFTPIVLASDPTSLGLVNSFLGFLAAFLIVWALTSFVLHPDIEDDNLKWVFIFFSILIVISVFTATFNFVATIG
jgi:hypothetical protein